MSRILASKSLTLATVGLALAGAAGCGSGRGGASNLRLADSPNGGGGRAQSAALNVPGVQRTATAVDGLRQVNQELANARGAVDETIAALDELSAARGDLLAPFQRFLTANQQVDDAERRIGERGEEMRTRARDYITNWEVEVYGVEDPDLRKQAESRRSRVRADYGRIADASRAVREQMAPFQKSLDDLETFLGNDLTPAGVRAAAPAIGRATQQGRALQQRIDGLSAELDRVAGAMTPAVPLEQPDPSGRPASDAR
jgi:hypothetical protein